MTRQEIQARLMASGVSEADALKKSMEPVPCAICYGIIAPADPSKAYHQGRFLHEQCLRTAIHRELRKIFADTLDQIRGYLDKLSNGSHVSYIKRVLASLIHEIGQRAQDKQRQLIALFEKIFSEKFDFVKAQKAVCA